MPTKPLKHPVLATDHPYGHVVSGRADCSHCERRANLAKPVTVVAFYNEASRTNDKRWCCLDCQYRVGYEYCGHENLYSNRWQLDNTRGENFSQAYIDVTPEFFFSEDRRMFSNMDQAIAHNRRRRQSTIAPYGYHERKPMDVHGWPSVTAEHELCFGVELEMENKRDTAEGQAQLVEALGGRDGTALPGHGGAYILARDGSLNQTGVELITNPYTLGYHQKQFGWDVVLGAVHGIGKSGKGTTHCGMHVHCNRQAISALTLGKVLVFMNHSNNNQLVDHVAQRSGSTYAGKSGKRIADGKAISGNNRYSVVNITTPTIEFRLFRGNLRRERVLKNIEFCHAIITYCSTASILACQDSRDFVSWLGKNRGAYKHLVRFLAKMYGYKFSRDDVSDDI